MATTLVVGCTPIEGYHAVAPVLTPPQLFAIDLEQERASGDASGTDVSNFVSDAAKQRIREAKSVAFIPPDVCAEIQSADGGTKSSVQVAATSCSVLMNALEQAATDAGYEVVSSQVLRSASIGGSVGYLENARNLELDVIFEVNEWNFEDRAQWMKDVREFRPLVQNAQGEFLPFELRMTDQWAAAFARCEAMLQTRLAQVESTGSTPMAALLSLKAVDVSNGRSLWFYTKRSDLDGQRSRGSERWIFAAPARMGDTGHTCLEYTKHVNEKYHKHLAIQYLCPARGVPEITAANGKSYGALSVGNYIEDPTPEEETLARGLAQQGTARFLNALGWLVVPLFFGIPLGILGNKKIKEFNAAAAEANEERGAGKRGRPVSYMRAEEVICLDDYLVTEPDPSGSTAAAPEYVSGYRVKRTSNEATHDPVAQDLIKATAEALKVELQGIRR